jgi:hypothetical protein
MECEREQRREFLKRAGKVAATAPAVALLLSTAATPASASGRYGGHGRGGRSHGQYHRSHGGGGRSHGQRHRRYGPRGRH